MKWYILIFGTIILMVMFSSQTSSYTTQNNTAVFTFELNQSYTLQNNTQVITFELNDSETISADTCSGSSNCVVTCGTNFTASSGSVDMNKYNITFTGSGTTYLLANISNFNVTRIGSCNIKLNGNRLN